MAFTVQSTMMEILTNEAIGPYARYMMYQGADPDAHNEHEAEMAGAPLAALSAIGWSPEGIAEGLNFFVKALEEGRVSRYPVYEGETDARKKDLCLIRIRPAAPAAEKPWIMLCAGGAYMSVCTMVESLPTARHMSEAGYDIFLMTYRVRGEKAALEALDDLEQAVRFVFANSASLGVHASRYAVGGFSAGANLISNWGAANIGWKKRGCTKPVCLFPVYTFIDLKREEKRDENAGLLKPMLGENYRENLEDFNVADHIDADYPPCYIVCGKDDNTVPPVNSELMRELLEKAGVRAELEEGEHAPHGFGDGTGTDVEGWPERAIAFLESLA